MFQHILNIVHLSISKFSCDSLHVCNPPNLLWFIDIKLKQQFHILYHEILSISPNSLFLRKLVGYFNYLIIIFHYKP